jgi:cell cycle checkpoint protein MEC1
LLTFREVIKRQYEKSKTVVPEGRILSRLFDKWKITNDKIEFFREMKTKFPPCLGDWYLEHFLSCQCYFRARQNYVKSVAIMSIIGYMIGLGDRHLENILIDMHSGEMVHVDFNCIFNSGEDLTYPETIPFRLTQSMVQAMGPLGRLISISDENFTHFNLIYRN